MACKVKANKITIYVNARAKTVGDGSKAAPFRSIALAFSYAKELLALPEKTDVTLSVAAGTYLLTETVSFRGAAYNPASSLTVKGVPGKTVITGAVPFDASLFEKVEENIYAAKVDGMGAFRTLYVDGVRASLAYVGGRYTDDEDIRFHRFDRTYDAKDPNKDARPSGKVYLGRDLFSSLIGDRTSGRVPVCVEYHGEYEWNYNIMRITSVDLDDVAVYDEDGVTETTVACYFDSTHNKNFAVPANMEAGLGQAGGYHLKTRSYFLAGAKAFLGRGGDYYYDITNETVYFCAKDDILSHTFACGKLDRLFSCEDARNMTFRGITFTGTDDMTLQLGFHAGGQASSSMGDFPTQAAFYSWDAYGLTFDNCCFAGLACEGIRLRGRVEHITVKNCVFRDVGACAIRMASPKMRKFDREDGNQYIRIENNLLEGIAREYYNSPAIMLTSSQHVVITRNTIRDCAYTGISLGWAWCYKSWAHDANPVNLDDIEISYNYITDYMRNLCDGGAIYTLGGNAPKEDHVLYNKCFNNCVVMSRRTGSGRGVCLMGIYYDGASTSWHSLHNMVVVQSQGADPDEENPGYSEFFLKNFRERRRRSVYYFSQDAGVYAANNWSYNVLNEECYLVRCRKTDPFERDIETHYCTMGNVEDIVPEEEKDGVLSKPMPAGLSFKDAAIVKRKKAAARDVVNKDMRYVYAWDDLSEEGVSILTGAGADGAHPDLDELKKDRY